MPEKPGPVAVEGVHGLGPWTHGFLPMLKAAAHHSAQIGTGHARMQPKTFLLGELAPHLPWAPSTPPTPPCSTGCPVPGSLADGHAPEARESLHENSKLHGPPLQFQLALILI